MITISCGRSAMGFHTQTTDTVAFDFLTVVIDRAS
jgi:hypothetical protein